MATVLSIDTIDSDPEVRGGRPKIAGRGVTVSDLVTGYLHKKYTPEALAIYYALTLGQVHAALAYYYDHKAQMDDEMHGDEEAAQELIADLDRQGKVVYLE